MGERGILRQGHLVVRLQAEVGADEVADDGLGRRAAALHFFNDGR